MSARFNTLPAPDWSALMQATAALPLTRRIGRLRHIAGLTLEADGPDACIGEHCWIYPGESRPPLAAEVVALRPGRVTLMPLGTLEGLSAGCQVEACGTAASIEVGNGLLGRVIDGLGLPLDEAGAITGTQPRRLRNPPSNPLTRPRISERLDTGVRIIDTLLTLGRGQRMGIFAGSGVGKSTLLGALARQVHADVNVIALIGERSREVGAFLHDQLGAEGLRRSVVIAAAADQPPLLRLRAAQAALTIAEFFQEQGQHVLLMLDSMTRYAMARREIGLAAGEPPTARGYTPSVFAELPELCERCGTAPSGGSITGIFTVLVEGDDMNEPVADALRSILDGHIVLSRDLAHRGHYPPIDPLASVSRVMRDLSTPDEAALASRCIETLALLDRHRAMIDMGAYQVGGNPALDQALALQPALERFLRQGSDGVNRAQALQQLSAILEPAA